MHSLQQAMRNATDGVSLLQTAEALLAEWENADKAKILIVPTWQDIQFEAA